MAKPARILIVEDNDTDVFLLRHAFREHQLRTELQIFKDGEDAKSFFTSTDVQLPDLVILDINLPRVDGLTLLRIVRAQQRFQPVPVVILTSSQLKEDRARALDAGANAFLHKAGSLDDFLALGLVFKRLMQQNDEAGAVGAPPDAP